MKILNSQKKSISGEEQKNIFIGIAWHFLDYYALCFLKEKWEYSYDMKENRAVSSEMQIVEKHEWAFKRKAINEQSSLLQWVGRVWIWNCHTFLSEYNTLRPGSSAIPHMESLISNTRFTSLSIFDLTHEFDLAEWYSNALKSQKYKLHLAEYSNWLYSWITIQT